MSKGSEAMRIQIVSKTVKGLFGRETTLYAVYREDDRYKDLKEKVFSSEYWWDAQTFCRNTWTSDANLAQDVFAYLTGERPAHTYSVVREGSMKE